MKEKTIHLREIDKAHTDWDILFDDAMNDYTIFGNSIIILYGNRSYSGTNDDILKSIEKMFDYYDYYSDCYKNKTSYIKDYISPQSGSKKNFSKKEISIIIDLLEKYKNQNVTANLYKYEEVFNQILSIVYGKEFRSICLKGCCQGDYINGFVSNDITQDDINYIESIFFGLGCEYYIEEADMTFYVAEPYGDNIKNEALNYLSDKNKDAKIVLQEIDGYIQTPKYKEREL